MKESHSFFDLSRDAAADARMQHRQIVARLYRKRELQLVAETAPETLGGLGRNCSSGHHDLLNALRRDMQLERKRRSGQTARLGLTFQNAARANVPEDHGGSSPVAINHLNGSRLTIVDAKHQPPAR